MPLRLVSQEEPLKGYRLLERLGRGGFGEVWKVEAPGGLLKAMKFVFGDLDGCGEDSRPAEQELKALKRVQTIRHPFVLSLERYDIIEGQLMIVMELADRNLWDRYRECRSQGLAGVPREELVRYMEETAEALDLMNNHYQIQHLDIKPQNLFLVFNHIKVGDFGLAKLLERERATVTGGVTPVYAAPETFEGYVSRFSDQYSLAIVFQELLTGVRPFTGANTRQLLMQHISGSPDLSPLPASDKPIIARALAKKPEERWPTCMEMVRAIKLGGSPPAPEAAIARPGSNTPGNNTPGAGAHGRESDPLTDSNHPTRVQAGGSGKLGTDPMKTQTPLPAFIAGKPAKLVPPGTPMPPLVTVGPSGQVMPRLVTPSPSDFQGPAMTLNRPQIFQTARMNSTGIAPPEEKGDGALFPALVIGVGHIGRLVLETLRSIICDHFGTASKVPNIRFLCLDTDPEAGASAPGVAGSQASLSAKEIVVARLNRPTHYLQRESLPPVDQWLPPGALYKISRNPGAAEGVRAFGRLALFDNYRIIAQRVRQEIETFLSGDSLEKAKEATQLGLRSNRPRAYVVAGLGGGTGGGMFLDLAFLIRQELRGVGYFKPEVVGMFFVPPADRTGPKNSALGNTYAALEELFHFQAKRTKYQTTFDKAEAPIQDHEAPFARVAVLQLPKTVDPKGRGLAIARAARGLFNEMATPAGRVVDEVRDVYRNAFPSRMPTCQAFGLYRLSWPRPEVLAASTRRFAQRLMQQWIAKDVSTLRGPIATWMDSQWSERKLDFERVVESFENAARASLREAPEKVFDAFIDPLQTRTPSTAKLDASTACSVLEQLLGVAGKPDPANSEGRGSLHAPLVARFEELCRDGEAQLALMAVTFIEQPQYRLAGSEEAVRQIGERLKRQVDTLEPLHADLAREVKQVYSKLLSAIGGLSTGGSWKAAAEVIDLLRAYPRKRLRLDILELALSAYRKLLGATPEYLRDIGICRAGLTDMHAAIAASPADSFTLTGPGRLILPDGCQSLDDAADRFLAGINPADVLAFDQSVQHAISKKFRGLAAICLKPIEKGPLFRELLLLRSREFLDSKLDAADPAAVFFRCRNGDESDFPLIGEAFEGAAPEIAGFAGKKPDELAILAAPAGPTGDQFRALAGEALPGVDLTPAPLPDDIVIYREYPLVELADLPQLGEHGRAAAEAMRESGLSPHSRVDIPWAPPRLEEAASAN